MQSNDETMAFLFLGYASILTLS